MAWKTYLIMHFGTNNVRPTDIAKKIEELGFVSALGPADFIYEWQKEPSKEEVLALADRISEALSGSGSVFNLDTHE